MVLFKVAGIVCALRVMGRTRESKLAICRLLNLGFLGLGAICLAIGQGVTYIYNFDENQLTNFKANPELSKPFDHKFWPITQWGNRQFANSAYAEMKMYLQYATFGISVTFFIFTIIIIVGDSRLHVLGKDTCQGYSAFGAFGMAIAVAAQFYYNFSSRLYQAPVLGNYGLWITSWIIAGILFFFSFLAFVYDGKMVSRERKRIKMENKAQNTFEMAMKKNVLLDCTDLNQVNPEMPPAPSYESAVGFYINDTHVQKYGATYPDN